MAVLTYTLGITDNDLMTLKDLLLSEFISDLKSRINPAYAQQRGTESYERRLCVEAMESLLADKDRLDWLANKDNTIGNVQLPTECVTANIHSLRGAIDAAMQIKQE